MSVVEIPEGYCQCGCGGKTKRSTGNQDGYKVGEMKPYVRGHHMRSTNFVNLIAVYKQTWCQQRPRVAYGFCWCGCGQRTTVAPYSHTEYEWVQGEPRRYVVGHQKRINDDSYAVEDRGFRTHCWIWPGAVNASGYPITGKADGLSTMVHRRMYERQFGTLPAGYQVHHMCREKLCINPSHLCPLTPHEHGVVTNAHRQTQ